ncbi:gamma-glutamyltransferase family protein [Paucibacter sp. APW11]|uniref:Gamma-glutamyltransferase family protein n=1 Tax=Roseateles aquae TaxID=3077235 RepID=A0ABU3P948_9BURK|nr:gamma-glutamyltransferase family protein [Paucibacter sp. APW11]MDT8999106.1 gamma-glutamyltransferase family protein [Paucibacter sp. APW11]
MEPEAASGWQAKPGWRYQRQAVAAAHPLASEAGLQMLREGGTAVDAALAAQLVLALVEPQSSGLGAGALLMSWDGQQITAWDGRETAPAAADESLFVKPNGQSMSYGEAVVGGRSVGTPGLLRLMEAAHRAKGKLAWARLFEPAIRLAEQGFPIGKRLATLLRDETALAADAQARAYFFDSAGKPWPEGHVLRNPALAAVLRRLAKEGADAFYRGPVAADIVRRVRGHERNPGLLSEADLAAYQVKRREAICTDWREAPAWRVCGFPPPSSGHLALMQILTLLPASEAATGLAQGLQAPGWLHRYSEAAKLAYADRDLYIADPDFVPAPGGRWDSLLAPAYLRQRAALIGPRSMGIAEAGRPGDLSLAWAPQAAQQEHGTSHISVVDAAGRAVAMTTTIEAGFGSRLMSDGGSGRAGGFLLNNELTDFALRPRDDQGRPVANRVEPGKRPRSSMSPTLVFDGRDGRLLMTLGSPGGQTIIHFVAKTLLASHDWGLDVQRAIELPNVGNFNGPTVLERGRFPATTAAALRERGHIVLEREFTSGLQAIERRDGGWLGGADPRREGVVLGD